MKVTFNEEKCMGCYACHVACIAQHHSSEEENVHSYRVIQKVQEEGFQKNLCIGCSHCGLCMEKCPAHAIYKEEEFGLILVDKEKCVKCHTCEKVCPKNVIFYDEDGKMEKCDGCIERLREGREPACVRVCCAKAIEMNEQ
jgi:formate dehydrogenase iron-sulfur subunit